MAKFVSYLNPLLHINKWWKLRGFKKWLLLAVILIILFIIFRQISALINQGKPNLSRYDLIQVSRSDIQKVITKEGVLEFAGVVDIPAPASGIITDLWVKDGDRVRKGQKLLVLKSTASPLDQAQALSAYLAAKNTLENAKTSKNLNQVNLEAARQAVLDASQNRQNMDDRFAVGDHQNPSANRPNRDYTQNEIESIRSAETQARSRFLIAERQYNQSDADIQAAQAALSSAYLSYQLTRDTVLQAPFDGQVTNLILQKGETVSSTDGFIMRLITSSDLLITLKVSEAEILYFQPGQKTTFKTPIYLDQNFAGEVVAVDTLGTEVKSDNGSIMEYLVKIKPEAIDKKMLSPLTVDTDTVVEQKSQVIAVPNAAVTYGSGKKTLTIVVNGKTKIQEVAVGTIADNKTEILSGLSENDTILVPKSANR